MNKKEKEKYEKVNRELEKIFREMLGTKQPKKKRKYIDEYYYKCKECGAKLNAEVRDDEYHCGKKMEKKQKYIMVRNHSNEC